MFETIKKRLTSKEVTKMLKDVTNRDFHIHIHLAINLLQKEDGK